MNAKSPANTVSSMAHSSSTASTGDEGPPPRFIGLRTKVGVAPSSSNDGYSKLGLDAVIGISSSSSKGSSSNSKSSKRSAKDRTKLYQKMRASTPSPGPSQSPYSCSPVKTPISPPNQFHFPPTEHTDLPRPHVRRQVPTSYNGNPPRFHLVSPGGEGASGSGSGSSGNPGAIRPSSFKRWSPPATSVVTPEKSSIDEYITSHSQRQTQAQSRRIC